MSRVLIQQYLAKLSRLRQVSGTHRASVVREAFKDLNRQTQELCRFCGGVQRHLLDVFCGRSRHEADLGKAA